MPQNDQIWPKIGIFGQFGPGHAGLFNALLVGRLVVVARRLYLARHLFTLSDIIRVANIVVAQMNPANHNKNLVDRFCNNLCDRWGKGQ